MLVNSTAQVKATQKSKNRIDSSHPGGSLRHLSNSPSQAKSFKEKKVQVTPPSSPSKTTVVSSTGTPSLQLAARSNAVLN